MMGKREFIKKLDIPQTASISNLYDRMILSDRIGKSVFTGEFYTPNIWTRIQGIQDEIGVKIASYGIFEDAERRIIAFGKNIDMKEYPIDLIKIRLSSKFFRLHHGDYLGSLMSLGIKREKFGDLILNDDGSCYVACLKDITKYIEINFKKVGNTPCTVKIEDAWKDEVPKCNFKLQEVIVSSMRLDCIVGALSKTSRSHACQIIKSGKVNVNYFECCKKDAIMNCSSTLTIRGHGKFKLIEEAGTTAKGRIKLTVKKFI
jgi:RNA-binding protein YlmH